MESEAAKVRARKESIPVGKGKCPRKRPQEERRGTDSHLRSKHSPGTGSSAPGRSYELCKPQTNDNNIPNVREHRDWASRKTRLLVFQRMLTGITQN